jgi:hypothetical protein
LSRAEPTNTPYPPLIFFLKKKLFLKKKIEMYEGGKRGHKGYLVLDTSNANQIKHSAPRQNKLNPANVIIRQNLGNKSSYIPITAVIQ